MKTMPDKSVDAVITDPPYGIGFKYSQHDDTPDGYGKWLWSILEMAESKANSGAPLFVFQAAPNFRKFFEWFPRDFRIYISAKNFVQIRPTAMQWSYDPVIVWWKDGDKYSAGTASRDYYVANTAPHLHTGYNDARGHPCPRPLDQMLRIVEQWVKPIGIVFDPFMGSGTTGVACVQLGRNFIGCEIDPKYYAIAEKRIKYAAAQPQLFTAEKQPQPEQEGLI
jgi:DNA modification methylase